MRILVEIRVIASTGVDDFPRPQDRAAISALSTELRGPRSPWGKLFAHILRQRQAAARARVTVRAPKPIQGLRVRATTLPLEKVWMVLDLLGGIPKLGRRSTCCGGGKAGLLLRG